MENVEPLIALNDIYKSFPRDDLGSTLVLNGVSLSIYAGEFVAIMGPSGSGKSTLMNIIGCLDKPSSGHYRLSGVSVSQLEGDDLAFLRRITFGFIFQQYQLITTCTVIENMEIPAVYAGQAPALRRQKALGLLERLDLKHVANHHPGQLSGGQQQRVAIGRALINDGQIILADEPTGALDSNSSREVLDLLTELWRAGHTIILITHDPNVAKAAQRVVRIEDGVLVSDVGGAIATHGPAPIIGRDLSIPFLMRTQEAFRSAKSAIFFNPVRTGLTLLGIIIGVAAIIALVAVGQGAKRALQNDLAKFGGNQIFVFPTTSNTRAGVSRLTTADVQRIGQIPSVDLAIPYVGGSVTIQYGSRNYTVTAAGVTPEFTRVYNWPVRLGAFFTPGDEKGSAPVAVIGDSVRRKLFSYTDNPIGKYVLVNNTPFEIIGVLLSKGTTSDGEDPDDRIILPFSTATHRVFGRNDLTLVAVLAGKNIATRTVSSDIDQVLKGLHQNESFNIYDRSADAAAEARSRDTLTMLLGSTAAISLLVGGISVMNIMLVSVAERVREIGIRAAVGARNSDIMYQFILESVMITSIGGIIGCIIGILFSLLLYQLGVPIIITLRSVLFSFVGAVFIGTLFGFLPARHASKMEPRVALAR